MHKKAEEIIVLLKRANLTPGDFLNVTDKLMNSASDVEANVIALLAPLSEKEKEQVMKDLAGADLARSYLSYTSGTMRIAN